MSTDKALILQPALSGRLVNSGSISTALAGTGSGREAFLQALLQQLQGLGAEIQTPVANLPAVPGGKESSGLMAIIDQLKVLAGRAGLVGPDQSTETAVDGNLPETSGKLLPNADALKEQLEGQILSPEQLAQFLMQFMPQQSQAEIQSALPQQNLEDSDGAQSFVLAGLTTASGTAAVKSVPIATEADSADSGVDVTAGLIKSAGTSHQAKFGNDSPEFSALLEKADVNASSDLPNSDQTLPDMKIAPPGIGGMQQPAIAPAKELAPPMNKPVGQPGWSQELGDRVAWMTAKGMQTAELRLNPPQMGPLEVRIHMNQDQANIQFVSQHAAVRDALESAIPKLREMMGAQQLDLTEVNVSPQSFAEQGDNRNAHFAFDQQSGRSGQGSDGQVSGSALESAEAEPAIGPAGGGLLSLYA